VYTYYLRTCISSYGPRNPLGATWSLARRYVAVYLQRARERRSNDRRAIGEGTWDVPVRLCIYNDELEAVATSSYSRDADVAVYNVEYHLSV
jgi:hypothetical protein